VRVDLAAILAAQNRTAEAKELLVRALPHLEHAADLQDVYKQGSELLRKLERD
jgi:seryl-tRNA(Sec) selenium transferase